MTARSDHEESARYFKQVATLRLSLQYNIEDFAFAQSSGRINYIMDANVVRFFLNPAREKNHTAVFGPVDRLDYAAATAMITAEFLFSRKLAGQGNRPALITPGHASDIVDIIGGLRRKRADNIEPVSEQARRQLDALADGFEQDQVTLDDMVVKLKQHVPNLVQFMHEGPGAEATHLLRLHDEDLLCPLELHPDATRDILELTGDNRREVEQWVRRLNREIGGDPASRSTHDAEKILRDAESLVQVMRLDEEAAASEEKLRYVLVTTHRKLFDAYARWYWSREQDEVPNARFILRTPLQYVPILNVREMPNGIESSDAVARGRAALDDLLAGFRQVDARYPHILSVQRLMSESRELAELLEKLFGFNPFELSPNQVDSFRAARNQWHELFRSAVVLNLELMARRKQAEFSRMTALLRSSTDLRMAVHEDQIRILGRVEAAHIAFSTGINIRLLTRDQEGGRTEFRRAPLVLQVRFPRVTGDIELETALDRLARHDPVFTAQVSRALEREADEEALFFAACVSHRCGLWTVAWHFASRALSRVGNGPGTELLMREIIYLRASATRYALPSAAAVIDAFEGLDRLITEARADRDTLGIARVLCELTSLILVVLYACRLAPTEAVLGANNRARKYVPAFRELLEEAIDAIERELPVPQSVVRILARQIWANVLAADALVLVAGAGHSADAALRRLVPSAELIECAEAKLAGDLAAPDCIPIMLAEATMSRWGRHRLRRNEALGLIDQLIAETAQNALTDLDKAELQQFREVLAPKQVRQLVKT
jgi:hypothetical protein